VSTILVIEDETAIRENLIDLLNVEGFTTVGAENGHAGLEKALAAPPDLILCDVGMPELDGFGVLKALRRNPITATIPFVFVTARSDRQDVRAGMNLGADDYLAKPFTRADLLECVKTRLRRAGPLTEDTVAEPALKLDEDGSLAAGQFFDRYRIDERVGSGGMGVVYRAYDTRLHRAVALKVLQATTWNADEHADTAGGRLLVEARAAAKLNHPNVVSVFDVGTLGDVTFLVMEFVTGMTLRQLANDPVPRKLRWLMEVASALAAAHRADLVHRDVKPENVMVRADGRALVLDFGLVRSTSPDHAGPVASAVPGSLRGTPPYMAPEQFSRKKVDGRTDQFAWGVMAYELITGALPWGDTGDHPVNTALAIVSKVVPPLASIAPDVPVRVADAVDRALAKDPAQRFASMDALLDWVTPSAAAWEDRSSRRDLSELSGGSGAAVGLAHTVSATVLVDAGVAHTERAPAHADGPLGASGASTAGLTPAEQRNETRPILIPKEVTGHPEEEAPRSVVVDLEDFAPTPPPLVREPTVEQRDPPSVAPTPRGAPAVPAPRDTPSPTPAPAAPRAAAPTAAGRAQALPATPTTSSALATTFITTRAKASRFETSDPSVGIPLTGPSTKLVWALVVAIVAVGLAVILLAAR